MAPFTMATFPLQSCRMGTSSEARRLRRRRQSVDRDGSRFGTAVEADAAPGADFAGVHRGMHAVCVQVAAQLQALGRTGLDAQPAPLALFDADGDISSCWSRHIHLVVAMACGRGSHLVCSQYA